MLVVLLSHLAAQTPAGYKPPKACAPFSTDDGSVENCEAWCSELYSGNHCPRCSCKTCSFCTQPSAVPAAVAAVATASAFEEEEAPSDDFGTVIGVGGGSTLRNGGRGRVGLLRDAFDEDEEEIGGARGGGPRGGGGGFALD